jgi:hypothetical protein
MGSQLWPWLIRRCTLQRSFILGLFDGEIDIYEKGAEQLLKIKRMNNQRYLKDELLLKEEDPQK